MLNISTIFAHCEYDDTPLRVRVDVKPGDTPYVEIESIIGIFISRDKLQQLADAINLALAPSAEFVTRETAARDTLQGPEVTPEPVTPFDTPQEKK